MPYSIRVDSGRNLATQRYWGKDVTSDLAVEGFAKVIFHSGFRSGMRHLVDIRLVATRTSVGGIRKVLQFGLGMGHVIGRSRIAMVSRSFQEAQVAKDARRIASGNPLIKIAAFTTIGDALRWLEQ